MTRVHFTNVGRGNDSWIVDINDDYVPRHLHGSFMHEAMVQSVRKNSTVISVEISFIDPNEEGKGTVSAGMHTIGEYRIELPEVDEFTRNIIRMSRTNCTYAEAKRATDKEIPNPSSAQRGR